MGTIARLTAIAALAAGACGAPTFRQGADEGAGPRAGFEASSEAQPAAPPEELMVDDDSIDFDREEGPFEEVQ